MEKTTSSAAFFDDGLRIEQGTGYEAPGPFVIGRVFDRMDTGEYRQTKRSGEWQLIHQPSGLLVYESTTRKRLWAIAEALASSDIDLSALPQEPTTNPHVPVRLYNAIVSVCACA